MFSRAAILIFAIISGVLLYLAIMVDAQYSKWFIFPVILGTISFIFANQIQWWWNGRNPREIDDKMRQILLTHYPFYTNLSVDNKQIFRQRMHAYMMGNNFMPQGGMEKVMTDMKGIIAASAVRVTFGRPDSLIGKYENIILYPAAFPSPQFPNEFHASEVFEEDGVIMFSLKHLFKVFKNPTSYFDNTLYEFVRVFQLSNPQLVFPKIDESMWGLNETITGVTKEYIEKHINLLDIDLSGVMMVAFFTFSDKFKFEAPRMYEQYMDVFNLDLVEKANPVVRKI